MTLFERGREEGRREAREEGRKEGFIQGQRKMLLIELEAQFGPLSARVQDRLQSWPAERLPDLALAVVRAQSLKELGLEE
jgi:flagellar biosynthesis/type III secretory pathway protein FliH